MIRHALVLTIAITGMTACGSTPQAPMHVYNSSFLENEGVVDAKPRDRSFDPLRMGDYAASPSVYVVRNDGRWTDGAGTPEPDVAPSGDTPVVAQNNDQTAPPTDASTSTEAPAETQKPSKTPSLSTTSETGVGGKQAVDSSATSDESNEAKVETGGYAPKTAAEFVSAVYGMNGVSIPAASPASIYKECKAKERVYFGTRPKVGDIVFFHNTFDANADGRNNDWYTHVGMIQAVSGDGTAEVVAWKEDATTVHRINLESPEVAEAGGDTLNTRLRKPGNDDAPFTQYYAGQLFAGFCGILGEKDEFVLVENWQPGMVLEK